MTGYQELKRLAEDCKERGIDFDDVSPHQGSTSCDKLVRHYLAAAAPDVVLSMIDHVQKTDAANLEWMQRSVEQSKEIDRLRTQNQVLLEALQAIITDRDDMCFDKEKHVESKYGAYWSPSASMVHSHIIAQARAALAQAEGGV